MPKCSIPRVAASDRLTRRSEGEGVLNNVVLNALLPECVVAFMMRNENAITQLFEGGGLTPLAPEGCTRVHELGHRIAEAMSMPPSYGELLSDKEETASLLGAAMAVLVCIVPSSDKGAAAREWVTPVLGPPEMGGWNSARWWIETNWDETVRPCLAAAGVRQAEDAKTVPVFNQVIHLASTALLHGFATREDVESWRGRRLPWCQSHDAATKLIMAAVVLSVLLGNSDGTGNST